MKSPPLYNNPTYKYRLDNNLCVGCGASERELGTIRCESCNFINNQRSREAHKARRQRAIERDPVVRAKQRFEALKASGQCTFSIKCTNPPVTGKNMCQQHLDEAAEYAKNRREFLKRKQNKP